MSDRRAFGSTLVLLWVVVFVAVALLTPPDPFTQLLYAGPGVVLAVPAAWWLTYRDGAERLRRLTS